MATKKTSTVESIVTVQLRQDSAEFFVLGEAPLIIHAMSAKAQRELLMPKGRKTAADKALTLKHDPYQEFRDCLYHSSPDSPTTLCMPTGVVKAALCNAALVVPGARKAEMSRLLYVPGDFVPIYGTPMLHMSVVRSSDMNRTPDVRTRIIVPRWAARLTVRYMTPIVSLDTVVNLLAAAGLTIGWGDWRIEKGGSCGAYRLVDSAEIAPLLNEAREVQDAAMAAPAPYDANTAELLSWYEAEAPKRRGGKPQVVAA